MTPLYETERGKIEGEGIRGQLRWGEGKCGREKSFAQDKMCVKCVQTVGKIQENGEGLPSFAWMGGGGKGLTIMSTYDWNTS